VWSRLKSQAEKAEEFRALHHKERILVLPNAWDVPSARIFEEAGFPAVATTSAGMMVSLGYPDGEVIDEKALVAAVARIGRVLTVPLSVDIVAGFGHTTKDVVDTVRDIVKTGAVGINIEDFEHATKKLFPVAEQSEKIKRIRELAKTLKIPIVINARTDALRYAEGNDDARFAEAVRRGTAFRDAGADCIYPMGLTEASAISTFVKALQFPVNVMVRKGLPSISELQKIGVARVSFGPSASYATMGQLKRISKEVIEKGTFENLVNGAITYDELNSLASPRAQE
jgi:2-methylisocitrate lyase-like PEP mutase family enzyme